MRASLEICEGQKETSSSSDSSSSASSIYSCYSPSSAYDSSLSSSSSPSRDSSPASSPLKNDPRLLAMAVHSGRCSSQRRSRGRRRRQHTSDSSDKLDYLMEQSHNHHIWQSQRSLQNQIENATQLHTAAMRGFLQSRSRVYM